MVTNSLTNLQTDGCKSRAFFFSLPAGSLCIPFLKLPQSLITLHNRQLVVRHSGWLSIHFCSLTQSVSCRSTEKSDKLKYPASCNERQPLCKCNFIYFFITVTPLLLQPTPWVLQQIMCCSHLFLTGVLQGPHWDHLRCHHHQLLSLMLSAVSLFKIIYQGEEAVPRKTEEMFVFVLHVLHILEIEPWNQRAPVFVQTKCATSSCAQQLFALWGTLR